MKKTIKKNRTLIKNIVFIICLIVLVIQFEGSFSDLVDLVDTNQPYIQIGPSQEPLVFSEGQIVFDEVLKKTEEQGQSISYVRTDTLMIYTYKLFQTILLLLGIFMCLIFITINNRDFSLIELMRK